MIETLDIRPRKISSRDLLLEPNANKRLFLVATHFVFLLAAQHHSFIFAQKRLASPELYVWNWTSQVIVNKELVWEISK